MMPNSSQTQSMSRIAAVAALTAALLVSATVSAAPQAKQPRQAKQEDGQTITPNYKDADLSQIIQAVAEVTGKNFIIDPRVNAKVTMLSATPMSPDAFYEAFLSVLQVYGYVAVPAGKVIKIVPNTDARQLPANDLPQQCQFDFGRNCDADHHPEECQCRAAGAHAAAPHSAVRPSGPLCQRQHADHLGPRQQCEPHRANHRAHGSRRSR